MIGDSFYVKKPECPVVPRMAGSSMRVDEWPLGIWGHSPQLKLASSLQARRQRLSHSGNWPTASSGFVQIIDLDSGCRHSRG